jgi:hypothetical protein
MKYIEEEITLAELADRFLRLNDLSTPELYDMEALGIEVETIDTNTGEKVYKPIKTFVVKNEVSTHYTDGKLKGTGNHRVIEDGKEIFLKEHPDFTAVEEPIRVVDIEVADFASYLANGRLHHNTTSGGKAIGFHASTRIRLSQIGKLKDSAGNIIGITTKAVVTKNRLGPPYREAEFNIYFNRGIDDYSSWLDVLKENGIIKQSGAWYSYEDQKFQSKEFPQFLESNQERKAQLYDKICEALIMKYEKDFDPSSVNKESAEDEDEVSSSKKQLLND